MRTLYHSPSACSLATHIVLEGIGAPFALHRVSIREGENLRLLARAAVEAPVGCAAMPTWRGGSFGGLSSEK